MRVTIEKGARSKPGPHGTGHTAEGSGRKAARATGTGTRDHGARDQGTRGQGNAGRGIRTGRKGCHARRTPPRPHARQLAAGARRRRPPRRSRIRRRCRHRRMDRRGPRGQLPPGHPRRGRYRRPRTGTVRHGPRGRAAGRRRIGRRPHRRVPRPPRRHHRARRDAAPRSVRGHPAPPPRAAAHPQPPRHLGRRPLEQPGPPGRRPRRPGRRGRRRQPVDLPRARRRQGPGALERRPLGGRGGLPAPHARRRGRPRHRPRGRFAGGTRRVHQGLRGAEQDPRAYARGFIEQMLRSGGERYRGHPATLFQLFPR